ncbi:MAG: bifunctional nuclease family protein [Planctomycetes bacterium]|nr:bifunctional nuclease family protein [Planctomycetota bacterium]
MDLSRIIIRETVDHQVVILKERNGDERSFPIVIGFFEAMAIRRGLTTPLPTRPMTHDLIRNVVYSIGGTIERIVVSDLKDGTFFAVIVILVDGKEFHVDSRPSDALAISAGTGIPLYVSGHVFDAASSEN